MADNNKSGLDIKSTAKAVADEKAKQQAKELTKMKAKAAADEKKAKAARTAVGKTKQSVKQTSAKETQKVKKQVAKREKELTTVAMAAGGSLVAGLAGAGSKKQKVVTLAIIGVVVAAVVVGLVFFRPQIANLLGLTPASSTGLGGLLPDPVMGYNKIDFENAILGEAREKQELIVMEQDVEVESKISSALANLAIFEKTKVIRSFGTGVYTVDMSQINAAHIEVDETAKTVTVTIPHTILQYVNVNIDKTEFEETKKAILGFGDIKMTQEQQKVLSESIEGAMREKLNQKQEFEKADEFALLKVREIFQPLVTAVSKEFIVKIKQ